MAAMSEEEMKLYGNGAEPPKQEQELKAPPPSEDPQKETPRGAAAFKKLEEEAANDPSSAESEQEEVEETKAAETPKGTEPALLPPEELENQLWRAYPDVAALAAKTRLEKQCKELMREYERFLTAAAAVSDTRMEFSANTLKAEFLRKRQALTNDMVMKVTVFGDEVDERLAGLMRIYKMKLEALQKSFNKRWGSWLASLQQAIEIDLVAIRELEEKSAAASKEQEPRFNELRDSIRSVKRCSTNLQRKLSGLQSRGPAGEAVIQELVDGLPGIELFNPLAGALREQYEEKEKDSAAKPKPKPRPRHSRSNSPTPATSTSSSSGSGGKRRDPPPTPETVANELQLSTVTRMELDRAADIRKLSRQRGRSNVYQQSSVYLFTEQELFGQLNHDRRGRHWQLSAELSDMRFSEGDLFNCGPKGVYKKGDGALIVRLRVRALPPSKRKGVDEQRRWEEHLMSSRSFLAEAYGNGLIHVERNFDMKAGLHNNKSFTVLCHFNDAKAATTSFVNRTSEKCREEGHDTIWLWNVRPGMYVEGRLLRELKLENDSWSSSAKYPFRDFYQRLGIYEWSLCPAETLECTEMCSRASCRAYGSGVVDSSDM